MASINPAHVATNTHFRFTTDHPKLNRAQRLFYEENGFLVIPKLMPGHLLDKYYNRFLDIIDGKVEKGSRLSSLLPVYKRPLLPDFCFENKGSFIHRSRLIFI